MTDQTRIAEALRIAAEDIDAALQDETGWRGTLATTLHALTTAAPEIARAGTREQIDAVDVAVTAIESALDGQSVSAARHELAMALDSLARVTDQEATGDGFRTNPSSKVMELFEPLFAAHDEFIRRYFTERLEKERTELLRDYPTESSSKHGYGDTIEERIWFDAFINQNGEAVVKEAFERAGRRSSLTLDRLSRQFKPDLPSVLFTIGGWETIRDRKSFEKKLATLIEVNIAFNRQKLAHAIQEKLEGLPVVAVKDLHSSIGPKGIQGRYQIKLQDGTTGTLHTQSVSAGGWNIQRFHYRYLMQLDRALAGAVEALPEPGVSPEVMAVGKILAPYMPPSFPGDFQLPDEARWEVERLKGASRNWGPLSKLGYIYRQAYGSYYIKRYHYYVTKKGYDFFRSLAGGA